MKRILTLAVLVSSAAVAEVDYSRCQFNYNGINVDGNNVVTVASPSVAKSIKTEGKTTAYEISTPNAYPGFNQGAPIIQRISITRDDQGRIVSSTVGDGKPTAKFLADYRKNIALMSSRMQVPNSDGTTYVQVRNPKAGEYPFRTVQIKDLKTSELRDLGITDVTADQLHDMQRQWHRDNRTQRRLQSIYEKLNKDAPVFLPLGERTEYEYVNGACVVKSKTSLSYTSIGDKVSEFQTFNAATCDAVEELATKYADHIKECSDSNVEMKMYSDLAAKGVIPSMGGIMGGTGLSGGIGIGGGLGGSFGEGGAYKAPSLMRANSGLFGMGAYGNLPGYGLGATYGGYGMYGFPQSPSQTIQMKKQDCELYGRRPTGPAADETAPAPAATSF